MTTKSSSPSPRIDAAPSWQKRAQRITDVPMSISAYGAETLEKIGYKGYLLPKDAPEKVLQFGEGNFLRAFVDRFFDMGNEATGWNGKVVMVQPISGAFGFADGINAQDDLYTVLVRGKENGNTVDESRVISACSPCTGFNSRSRFGGSTCSGPAAAWAWGSGVTKEISVARRRHAAASRPSTLPPPASACRARCSAWSQRNAPFARLAWALSIARLPAA